MGEDIPKRAVAVLLLLALTVSVISSIAVINAVESMQYEQAREPAVSVGSGAQAGAVSLDIREPDRQATSSVSLSIKGGG